MISFVTMPLAQPPPGLPSERLGFLLYRVGEAVAVEFKQAIAPYGLRAVDFGVLDMLAAHGPTRQSVLARALAVDRQTMAGAAGQLERRGLIDRRRLAQDRRMLELALTDRGARAFWAATEAARRLEGRLVAMLADDVECVRAALARIVGPEYDLSLERSPLGAARASATRD